MMKKKLIGFDEELVTTIDKYAEKTNKTFTEAVRQLILLGLNTLETTEEEQEEQDIDIIKKVKDLEKKIADMSWWDSDDIQSRLGNLELSVAEIEKKLNVVVGASKHFKGHLNNREIHLQD
jgi:hypothetical protein